jgi:hypothetical protein
MRAAVISLFLLLLLAMSQYDSVALVLSRLAARPFAVNPLAAAVVLTAFATFAAYVAERLLRRCGVHSGGAAGWWAVALAVVLPVSSPYCGLWRCAGTAFSALVFYAVFAVWKRRVRRGCVGADNGKRDYRALCPVVFETAALCLFMSVAPAAPRVAQYEQRAAQSLFKGQTAEALRAGGRSLDCSPVLFALRCYAWSKEDGGLPANFLRLALPGGAAPHVGSEALLLHRTGKSPYIDAVADSLQNALGLPPGQGGTEGALAYFRRCARQAGDGSSVAADYYLCALLLDKRLDDFARELRRYYAAGLRTGKALPVYYAQALTLYSHYHPVLAASFADIATDANWRDDTKAADRSANSATDANWRDYSDMGDKIPNRQERANTLRRYYGETYWWYYDYAVGTRQ